mmetsp:Transcript_19239/g.33033  ORF Transcript_19239/g.33033 Transcript_19239/m.33033 type:complete len:214 (-) Transcript_19239:255-896(-)
MPRTTTSSTSPKVGGGASPSLQRRCATTPSAATANSLHSTPPPLSCSCHLSPPLFVMFFPLSPFLLLQHLCPLSPPPLRLCFPHVDWSESPAPPSISPYFVSHYSRCLSLAVSSSALCLFFLFPCPQPLIHGAPIHVVVDVWHRCSPFEVIIHLSTAITHGRRIFSLFLTFALVCYPHCTLTQMVFHACIRWSICRRGLRQLHCLQLHRLVFA